MKRGWRWAAMPLMSCLLTMALAACSTSATAPSRMAQSSCPSGLDSDQELAVSVVAQREKDGQLYAALAALQSLPESSPEVLRYKGDVMRRLGRDEAGGYFQRLRKTCLAPWGEHGLGLMAADAGDLSLARERLAKAATAVPTEYRFRNDYGVALMHLQVMEEARFELMTALELSSAPQLPAVNLMTLFLVQEKPAAARSLALRYRLGNEEWQAAGQACTGLLQQWQQQGLPAPAAGSCEVQLASPVAVQEALSRDTGNP